MSSYSLRKMGILTGFICDNFHIDGTLKFV